MCPICTVPGLQQHSLRHFHGHRQLERAGVDAAASDRAKHHPACCVYVGARSERCPRAGRLCAGKQRCAGLLPPDERLRKLCAQSGPEFCQFHRLQTAMVHAVRLDETCLRRMVGVRDCLCPGWPQHHTWHFLCQPWADDSSRYRPDCSFAAVSRLQFPRQFADKGRTVL